ncbi:MAG: hypothetical protein JWM10_3219 [Myxococcaceae bacterium]|nr:hypothetical protein [Myxococcaceae bacterium]
MSDVDGFVVAVRKATVEGYRKLAQVYVPFRVNRTGSSTDMGSGSNGLDSSAILRTTFSVGAFDPATGQRAAVEFPNYRPYDGER